MPTRMAMKIILFVNESHFAAQVAAPTLGAHAAEIVGVFFSTRIRGQLTRVWTVARQSHFRYFVYRLTADMITRWNGWVRGRHSVLAEARRHGLSVAETADVNAESFRRVLPSADIAVTVNFDQVVKRDLIAQFPLGIVNLHASRLPQDKGISPVLWAFARGDAEIWATLYQMDTGIDSGPIYEQFLTPVLATDTAFSLYERVCAEGGRRLCALLTRIGQGKQPPPVPQPSVRGATCFSWPDSRHAAWLARSGRRLLSLRDVVGALTR